MSQYELKVNMNPPLKCYLWQLHPLSVVFAEDGEKYMPWLFNHYYTMERTDDFIKLESDPWCYEGEDIFLLKDFSALTEACDEVVFFRLLRNMIRLGYYCTTNVNERFLPGMSSYRKKDLFHSCLIYALDEEAQTVGILGYLADGNIGKLSVAYHDIYRAIEQDIYTPETMYVRYFKKNERFICDCFQADAFADNVQAYLFGTNETKGYLCLQGLKDSWENYAKDKMDIRNAYVVYEHKYLMYERLNYMMAQGLLTDPSLPASYFAVVEKSEKVKLLALKYNMTKQLRIPKAMATYLGELLEIERDVLQKAIKNRNG